VIVRIVLLVENVSIVVEACGFVAEVEGVGWFMAYFAGFYLALDR
jgi:hypothetical protein